MLSTYGVEYKATFPLMDRDEEDEAGGEDSHPLEAVVTSLSRPATAPVDQLALYAAHYLAGQHNILCNAWKYLQSTLQHSLQCIEGAYAEDGEEDEEEEEEEQGDEEEK